MQARPEYMDQILDNDILPVFKILYNCCMDVENSDIAEEKVKNKI